MSLVYNLFIYGTIYCFVIMAVSLAFTLLFGSARLLNLAHGGMFVIGGYLTYVFSKSLGVPMYLSIIIAIIALTALMFLVHSLLINQVKGLLLNEALILFCIGLILVETINLTWGDYSAIPIPEAVKGAIYALGVRITFQQILMISVSVITLAALWIFLKKSRYGLAIRAVALDEYVGTLIGIDPTRIYMLTWFICVVILVVFCVLSTPLFYLTSAWGITILITSLAVVILGGLGSLRGAIFASFIIGYLETFSASLFSHLRFIVTLAVIILILSLRPSGLFGKQYELEERM